jgi:hypothetical protein
MHEFRFSFLVTAVCLALAGWWGHSSGMGIWPALWLCFVLGVLEVSLSFDNAVVNAGVLKHMDEFWRQMFLTVGILIAVFGMRLVFPIVIVAVATGQGPVPVMEMAIENPQEYSRVLTDNYPTIAAFGGMFLLLVALGFLFDRERDLHWIGPIEKPVQALVLSPFVSQDMGMFLASLSNEDMNRLAELMRSGDVTPVVDRRYRLEDAAEAIRYLEQGRARGKVVVTME